MSTYLGFQPSQRPGYFFVSYNTEDAERITPIVTTLVHEDVPLWYDYGIEYGEKWAPQITEKLDRSQGVILFFTKGILTKENSYVRKEYRMAKEFLNKKVYIIMVDEIKNADIPINMLDWWIDITSEQSIPAYNRPWDEKFYIEIKKALGIETQEKKMNMLMENYLRLFSLGKTEEAEQYVSEYLLGKTLEEKAIFLAKVVAGKMNGVSIDSKYSEIAGYEFKKSPWRERITWEEIIADKRNHMGELAYPDPVCLLEINETLFVAGNCFLFHRGSYGDAHAIQLWRGNERIFAIGGLVEARFMHMYYDSSEDLLYLIFASDKETIVAGDCESTGYWSVAIIQSPTGDAVKKTFHQLLKE